MPSTTVYDVFLSHHTADQPAVEEIARQLARKGVRPWLDSWNLVPGEPWQEAIEDALARCATCAVFVGPASIGPWQNEEMRLAIDRRVTESRGSFRVIPVLLPGAERGERSLLPAFLRSATWVEYRQTLDEEAALHRLVSGIRGVEPGPGPAAGAYQGERPYRGLELFDVGDWPFFFGREAAIEWLLADLRPGPGGKPEHRFLGIIGPSGSGKSSLARAGLAAALRQGCLPGSADWPLAVFRPGADPLESLAVALAGALGSTGDVEATRKQIRELQEDRRSLHLAARLALQEAPAGRRLVVLVDQFEEIFTLCHDEAARRAMVDNLLYAATVVGGQVIVILTLRADFYGRCAPYPTLAAALSDHQMLVSPMLENELRQAIERPAQMVGAEFEPGLVERLLDDVAGQPGSLPLLEYALLELWNGQAGRRLTHAAYDEIGGVRGALPRRAEAIYASLSPADQQVCRRVFLALVQPGAQGETTKRRARQHELVPAAGDKDAVEAVVQKLSGNEARLITAEAELQRPADPLAELAGNEAQPTITEAEVKRPADPLLELAHEALIRNWPRLQGWIEQDRQSLRIHQEVREATQGWEERGRDPSYLYRGLRLRTIEEWRQTNAGALNESEAAFMAASIAARRHERRQRQETQIALSVLSLAVFAVLGVLGWMFLSNTGLFEPRETWVDAGKLQAAMTVLTEDPTAPNTLYAADQGGNLLQSLDGGDHWAPILAANQGTAIRTIVVPAGAPNVVYIARVDGTLLRSNDRGSHWTGPLPILDARGAWRLVVDPQAATRLYFTDPGAYTVYTSDDSGDSWRSMAVTDKKNNLFGLAAVANPGGPSKLYAGDSAGQLWRSVDGGSTWQGVFGRPLGNIISDILPQPAGGGLYITSSRDVYQVGGATQDAPRRLATGPDIIRHAAVSQRFPRAIFFETLTGTVYLANATDPDVQPYAIRTARDFVDNSTTIWLSPSAGNGTPLRAATFHGVYSWQPSRKALQLLK